MIAPVPMSRYPPSSVHYTASSTGSPSISSFAVPIPVPINPRPGVVSSSNATGAVNSASIGYPIYKTSSVVPVRSLNGLSNSNINQLPVGSPPSATGVVGGQESDPPVQSGGSIFGHRLFSFMDIDPDVGGEGVSGPGPVKEEV